MQLHALDSEGKLVSAHRAIRQADYECIECHGVVHLRGGPHRQYHFYHVKPTFFCRQHQKGPIHLQLQSYFLQHLPLGECQLEVPFSSIQRIADVVWIPKKIIFEIQCSPISADEVFARNRDYQLLGWKVIWILHDQRYNQFRLSQAELALSSSPHYFSNMNSEGEGIIYDQFAILEKDIRHNRLPPLPIHLKGQHNFNLNENCHSSIKMLKERATNWMFSLKGDLLSLFFHSPTCNYLKEAFEIEKKFYFSSRLINWKNWHTQIWHLGIVRPYRILFRYVLERMCR